MPRLWGPLPSLVPYDRSTIDTLRRNRDRAKIMQASIACPYCGEENTVFVDESAGAQQSYVEDCQVCCKPWQVVVTAGEDGELDVHLQAAAE